MIELPQRSIFRFFLPMVDLMMLLFSMFLLMPILEEYSATTGDLERMSRQHLIQTSRALREQLKDYKAIKKEHERALAELNRLRRQVRKLRPYAEASKELERLKAEVAKWEKRKVELIRDALLVHTLTIDPKNGSLLYYDRGLSPRPIVIDSRKKAADLIDRHRAAAQAKRREVFYLFQLPRNSPFPTAEQFAQYKRWFDRVPWGIAQ